MDDPQTITVQCPSCQASYQLTAEDAGQTVECVCSQQFVVPRQSPGISITCPACTARYELDPKLSGQEVECECGQRFIVSETASSDSNRTSAAITVACPQCSAQYELSTNDAGTTVECGCGFQFEVPQGGSTIQEHPPAVPETDVPLPMSVSAQTFPDAEVLANASVPTATPPEASST
ncbi:MAG: hypothetical protein VB858_00330, partial [Planctomycetaceae bacterium]